MPRIHGALRAVARRSAGRHHVSAIAVILHDGEVLVVSHVFRAGGWALPGGWIRRGEDPFRAIEREVDEELGIAVSAAEVLHAERQGEDGGGPSSLTLAIRCELPDTTRPTTTLSPELGAARWLPVGGIGTVVSSFELESIERAVRLGP